MPLNTDVTPNPPEIIINVFDDGGGLPTPHVADVHVSWDPAIMKYKSARPKAGFHHASGSGTARWHKKNIPGNRAGTNFFVVLERKKSGTTWVITSSHDVMKGQFKTKKRKLTNTNFP